MKIDLVHRSFIVARGAIVLVVASLTGCAAAMPSTLPHPLVMQAPKALEGRSLDGRTVVIPAAGQVTVVDFWATWCAPCLEMMPAIEEMHRAYRAKGVAVVGIAADDNPGLVAGRLEKMRVTYPNVLDDHASSLQGAYKVTDLPRTFVFDRRGRVRLVAGQGPEAAERIRAAVDFLLNEVVPP